MELKALWSSSAILLSNICSNTFVFGAFIQFIFQNQITQKYGFFQNVKFFHFFLLPRCGIFILKRLYVMKAYDQDIIIEQIVAYLDGRASSDEVLSLQTWMAQSGQHRTFFAQIRNIYEMSERKIDPSVIRTDKAIQKVLRRIARQRKTSRISEWLQRAAAVLFIPLLAASLYFHVQSRKTSNAEPVVNFCEMQAAKGSRSFFTLPDSTRVWLNSGSKIRYPDRFIGQERDIYLEGEAYFEVTSSLEHPFVVNTPTIQIRATGTKFHVADFADCSVKEVSLLSGKVAVGKTDANRNTTHLLDLNPGQHVEYDVTSHSTRMVESSLYEYYAWKDNKLVFRNDQMTDVVKRISQLYGVEIELQGEELKTYRYRATFEGESLDEILKFLKLSAPINYREVKPVQQADGTFTKAKIVIYPKNNKNQK